MANALYDNGRQGFLDGSINFASDNIKAVLVDLGTYTPNLATDANLSDIPSGARVSISPNLTSKTVTAGVADAADIVFSAVTGATVEAIVLFKDTGTPATSRLISFVDTMTGLPFTPNGGNVNLAWSNGANKIFKL
jgi:hypothetical protein